MKFTVISGSPREDRASHQVALELKKRLESKGHEVALIDVLKENLAPTASPNLDSKRVESISQKLHYGEGLLVVSPEYNGCMPGPLKNLLDNFFLEYQNKPVAVIGVSSGALGGILVVKKLQEYFTKMGAFVLPQYLITPFVEKSYKDGEIVDEFHEEQMNILLVAVEKLTKVLGDAYKK